MAQTFRSLNSWCWQWEAALWAGDAGRVKGLEKEVVTHPPPTGKGKAMLPCPLGREETVFYRF